MARTCTYLVTVTPGEVLGADVLVGVLGTLLKRGHMVPVLPVLVPQIVGIDTTTNEAGDNSTAEVYQPRWSNVIRCRSGTYKMESLNQRAARLLAIDF